MVADIAVRGSDTIVGSGGRFWASPASVTGGTAAETRLPSSGDGAISPLLTLAGYDTSRHSFPFLISLPHLRDGVTPDSQGVLFMRKSGVDSYSESHQHYRTSPTWSRSDQRQMCCPERKQKMKIFSTLSLPLGSSNPQFGRNKKTFHACHSITL